MNYCPFCQLPLDRPVNQCPSCNADLSDHQKGTTGGGTLKESVDDIRQLAGRGGTLQESIEEVRKQVGTKKERGLGRKSGDAIPVSRTKKQKGMKPRPVKAETGEDSALPFRPVNRPPTLILCALDDASRDEGEWYRVRKPEFRIGREKIGPTGEPNDIAISNDNGISSGHLTITLRIDDGRYRYYLKDGSLNSDGTWQASRNGTFVRVSRAALKADQDLLIGARRYFLSGDIGGGSPANAAANTATAKSTQGWEALNPEGLTQIAPKLVERTASGKGNEYPLNVNNVIGSDPNGCTIVVSGDPFVSSQHARVFKDKKDRWIIENQNSLNGIWLRIDEMALDTGGEFQIGEQRFLVRIP